MTPQIRSGRCAVAFVLVASATGLASAGVVQPQPKMGEPLAGLTAAQLDRFFTGQTRYNTPLLVEEGLGPIFNKQSCGNCHTNPLGGPGAQSVTRFGLSGKGGFDPLDSLGGSLLQVSSISIECAEVIPAEANHTAERVTPGMLGYGLVEAIPDADILALESAGPGVSGVAHMVEAFEDPGVLRVGKFGWKAQVPTMLTFSADAAQNEMGLSNRFIPFDNDPNGVNPPSLMDCDTVADPEDGPDGEGFDFIDRVADFQRFLAAPPQTPKSGMTGEAIFSSIGCTDCHTASYTTSNDVGLEDAIRNKTIRPYSDFLLHDVGIAADFIPQGMAASDEIRTPPLWGLRARNPMWHDGRFLGGTFADRVTDAIEEHGVFGSEGIDSFNAWSALSGPDKDAVIAFLDSLGRAEFDADGDNDVDLQDFLALKDCWGDVGVTPDDACAVHDIDQDGDIDDDDWASFLLVYEGPLTDCNANGVVDLKDILDGTAPDADNDGVIDTCCEGDVTQDGQVNFNDVLEALFNWGECAVCPADINGDGQVNFSDLLVMLTSWGPCV